MPSSLGPFALFTHTSLAEPAAATLSTNQIAALSNRRSQRETSKYLEPICVRVSQQAALSKAGAGVENGR